MAGLGRRTHYRKHVTDSVLHDMPEPDEDESIAVVVNTRGSNQFDIQLPHSNDKQLAILPTKFRKLVWLKRNDYVIVQRASSTNNINTKDTVDLSTSGATTTPTNEMTTGTASSTSRIQQPSINVAAASETGSIRCVVTHILYSEQIKHLRSKRLWPTDDPKFDPAPGGGQEQQPVHNVVEAASDGIVYEKGYGVAARTYTEEDDYDDGEDDDNDLYVNTNRLSKIAIQDDQSSDESDDD